MSLPFGRPLAALSLALTLALGLVACGGGDEPAATAAAAVAEGPAPATPAEDAGQALATLRERALALNASAVPASDLARQLMDFAELQFPQLFPAHSATGQLPPFEYRCYAATGVCLGVVTSSGTMFVDRGVYVVGGAFGELPLYVGQVLDFITPVETRVAMSLVNGKVAILQGGNMGIGITLTRAEGFDAAAEVTVGGLPEGVTARPLTIPAGATIATLVLDAQAAAPHSLPTSATITLRAADAVVSEALNVTVRGRAGSIDTSFGGGVNVTPVGIGEDYANAVLVQDDGKVLMAGSSGTTAGTQWSIVRYLRDGGLDAGFGNGGKVVLPIGSRGNDIATALALQPDGRILVAGSSDQGTTNLDFAAIRLLPDGRLDPTFGNAGKAIVDLQGDTDRAWAIALQADGRVVLGGQASTGVTAGGVDFALVRLTADGQLDATFGQGGRVISTLRAGNGTEIIRALALPVVDGEQRILAVGGEGDFVAARYRANGALDSGFGAGGKVLAVFNDIIGSANAVTLLPDGRALLAGHIGHRFAAIQLNVQGQLDANFGTAGRFVHALVDNWNEAQAVVRQADGKLVIGGWAYSGNGSSGDFAAIRLWPSGVLDTAFGQAGIVITPTASGTKDDQSHALALQADDRVPTVRALQAGEANGSNHDFVLLRLWL